MDQIRILAVEDDDVDYLNIERALKDTKLNVFLERAATLERAREVLRRQHVNCILLDYFLPDGLGIDLLHSSLISKEEKDLAVIMLTGQDDVLIAVEAMKQGADDYLPKSLVGPEGLEIALLKALHSVKIARKARESEKQIRELAFFDDLTSLPNRRVFDDRLKQLILAAKRENRPFIVGMLDMDGFKAINDNLGHQAGDVVLKTVASRLATSVREGDTVARFGGDEFGLLLPMDEPGLSAEGVAKRILDIVEAPIHFEDKQVFVGLSIGLSEYPRHGEEAEILLRKADAAMFEAKKEKTGWSIADDEPAKELGGAVSAS
ncbi:MAG: diguanylate cyclase [Alphaproteobacteria bacterium]|nr:diguanylate cyclase [Alphaproteobacteria bacterium]